MVSSDIVNCSSDLQPSAYDDEGHLRKQRTMSERARVTDFGRTEREPPSFKRLIRPRDSLLAAS